MRFRRYVGVFFLWVSEFGGLGVDREVFLGVAPKLFKQMCLRCLWFWWCGLIAFWLDF